MKKIILLILLVLITIFSFFLLILTVRGVPGNPSPKTIFESLRTEGKPFELSPERSRYALVLSIVKNNTLFFTKPIAAMALPDLGRIHGNFVSLFAPGVSLIATPFFIIGKTFGMSQFFTFATSAVFALLNLILITLIVKKLTGNLFAGLVGGLTFVFATVALPYAGTLYEHHYSTFLILMSIYFILDGHSSLKDIIIGLACGLGILIEYPNGIFFIPIIIWLVVMHISIATLRDKTQISIYLCTLFVGIGICLGIVPTLAYNKSANGSFLQLAGTVGVVKNQIEIDQPKRLYNLQSTTGYFKLEKIPQGLNVLLTSQDRGLIIFSPVILVGLLGFWQLIKEKNKIVYLLITEVLTVLLLFSLWGDPWGGWAYGPRYLIPAFAILAIGIGVAVNRHGKNFLFFIIFLVTFIYSSAVSLLGALTSLQLPPDSDPISSNYPSLVYLHDLTLLKKNISPSYLYNVLFVKRGISLYNYALIILILIVVILIFSYTISILNTKGDKK